MLDVNNHVDVDENDVGSSIRAGIVDVDFGNAAAGAGGGVEKVIDLHSSVAWLNAVDSNEEQLAMTMMTQAQHEAAESGKTMSTSQSMLLGVEGQTTTSQRTLSTLPMLLDIPMQSLGSSRHLDTSYFGISGYSSFGSSRRPAPAPSPIIRRQMQAISAVAQSSPSSSPLQPEYGYSDLQSMLLCIAATISGCLSIYGSCKIVYTVLGSKVNRICLSQRYIFMVSMYDIIFSTGTILGVYLMPKDATGLKWAFGNFTTCRMASCLFYFYIAVGWSNAHLAIYYYWRVVKNRTDDFINRKKYEQYQHMFSLLFTITYIIVLIITDVLNPSSLVRNCSVTVYPPNCLDADNDVECLHPSTLPLFEGGDRIQYITRLKIFYGFMQVPLVMLPFCIVSYCTLSVTRFVSHITRRASQYDYNNSTINGGGLSSASSAPIQQPSSVLLSTTTPSSMVMTTGTTTVVATPTPASTTAPTTLVRREQRVKKQAKLYFLSYLNTFCWPIILGILHPRTDISQSGKNIPIYILTLLAHCFFPLQGFFNYLVYQPTSTTSATAEAAGSSSSLRTTDQQQQQRRSRRQQRQQHQRNSGNTDGDGTTPSATSVINNSTTSNNSSSRQLLSKEQQPKGGGKGEKQQDTLKIPQQCSKHSGGDIIQRQVQTSSCPSLPRQDNEEEEEQGKRNINARATTDTINHDEVSSIVSA